MNGFNHNVDLLDFNLLLWREHVTRSYIFCVHRLIRWIVYLRFCYLEVVWRTLFWRAMVQILTSLFNNIPFWCLTRWVHGWYTWSWLCVFSSISHLLLFFYGATLCIVGYRFSIFLLCRINYIKLDFWFNFLYIVFDSCVYIGS